MAIRVVDRHEEQAVRLQHVPLLNLEVATQMFGVAQLVDFIRALVFLWRGDLGARQLNTRRERRRLRFNSGICGGRPGGVLLAERAGRRVRLGR